VAGVEIPGVIAIQAQDIDKIGDVAFVHGGAVGDGHGAMGIERAGGGDNRLEVGARALFVGRRFVGEAPHHDAGVVFVAGVKFAKGLDVVRLGFRVDPFVAEHDSLAVETMHADGRQFVDDQDAVPIGKLEMLFRIGIMAGAVGVGANPLEEMQVFERDDGIVAASTEVSIFMATEALEIDRLFIDEKLSFGNADGAQADGKPVDIRRLRDLVRGGDFQGIEYAASRSPELGIFYDELTCG